MPNPIGFRLGAPPRLPPDIPPGNPEEWPDDPGQDWPDDPQDPDFPDEPVDPDDYPEEGPEEIPGGPDWGP